MKALVYTGPESQEYRDVPDPEPAEGDVLIKVACTGICGSDMHAYLGHDERRPAPLILGHEVAGTVVSGPNAGKRRVAINPLVTSPDCPMVKAGKENLSPTRQIISMPPREGGFADYLTMPERNLVDVPDHVPDSVAALAEPLACGWHAVRLGRTALDQDDDTVRALVIGGGAIGFGAALCLRAQGISDVTVVEPHQERGALLTESEGLRVIEPDAVADDGQFDIVIDGVGYAATRATASAAVRPGGVIMHIGLGSSDGGLDIRRMTLQEITFIGTYTYTADDFKATADAMFTGKLGALDWAEKRSLKDGAEAFADLRHGRVASPKILLMPDKKGE